MADTYLTLLDIAKANARSANVADLIEENLNSAPEAMVIPARTISGTSFTTLIRKDFPRGSFRPANQGVNTGKSSYGNKTVEAYFYDNPLQIDEQIVRASDEPEEVVLAREASGAVKGALLTMGSQFWYGTDADAGGFPGARAIVDSSLVVDAGGTTDNVSSSVYGLVVGDDYAKFVLGKGDVFTMPDWIKQRITINSAHIMAHLTNLSGFVGAQFLSKYSVGRIKKITTDSGKGMTDALAAKLLSQFPVGVRPTHWFMSRRSKWQLQVSRAPVLQSGAGGKPTGSFELAAPEPTEMFGIPILTSDSILDTDTLAS